jgi:hypothetical protein
MSDLPRPTHGRYRLRDRTVNFNGGYPEPVPQERIRHGYPHTSGAFAEALEDYMGIRDLHLTRGNFWAMEEAPSRRLLPLPREEMVEDVEAGDDRIDSRNVNDNSDGDGEEDSSDDDDDSSADDGFNPLLRMEAEDSEFFCGTALGNHPSLEGITISHSRIQTRF